MASQRRLFWKSAAGYQVVFSYRSTFRRESSTTCPLLTPLGVFPRSSDSLSCYSFEQVDSVCLMEDFENEVSAGMEPAAMAVRRCCQSTHKIKLKFEHHAGQTQTTRLVVWGLHVIIFLRLDLINLDYNALTEQLCTVMGYCTALKTSDDSDYFKADPATSIISNEPETVDHFYIVYSQISRFTSVSQLSVHP